HCSLASSRPAAPPAWIPCRRCDMSDRAPIWAYTFWKAMPTMKSLYSVHPGVMMTQKWVSTLKEKTGRGLDEWLELVKKSGPKTEKEQRDWLKQEYKLGTNSAWWIAERASGKGSETDD